MGKEKKLATCVKHFPQNQFCVVPCFKNSIVKSAFECDIPVSVLFQAA